jgi:hypothetical protein
MLLKKGYACSFALHGEIGEPNLRQPFSDKARRRTTKTVVNQHYNTAYQVQPENKVSELNDQEISSLVGTKFPKDHWFHTVDNKMLSFYAGKVYYR